MAGGQDLDGYGAEEGGYAALCAGCEDGERHGTRPLRPPCTV